MSVERCIELADEFRHLAKHAPSSGYLKLQLQDAACSILNSLNDGKTALLAKEKRKCFNKAYDSLKECQAIFHITRTRNPRLLGHTERLAIHLNRLCRGNFERAPKKIVNASLQPKKRKKRKKKAVSPPEVNATASTVTVIESINQSEQV